MRLRPIALGAMLGICASSDAMAQAMPNIEAKRQTDIGLRLAVVHDSNISRSNNLVANNRGIVPDDYTLRPQLTFSVVQPFGRQAIYLQGDGGYDFHKENSSLDRRRINLNGGAIGALGICKLGIGGNYSAAQSELDDLAGVVGKNLQETTGENANVACGQDRGFNGALAGSRQDVTNSASRQKTADHTTDSGTVLFGYGNTSLGKASVVFVYSTSVFPNRFNAVGGVGDGYFARSLGLNYEKNFGPKWKIGGGAAASIVKRDSAPPGIPLTFKSTNYNALISYRASSRLNLAANTVRAVTPSNRAGKLFDVSTTSGVVANYKLGTSFFLSGGGRIADTKSNVDTAGIGAVITNSRDKAIFASIRYRQSQHTSLTLDTRVENRKTNLPQFDYSNTRFGLTLDVSF